MNSELTASALRRIDTACDNYEAAWREGRQPRIEDYLLACEAGERPQLLESLQKLQQELILSRLSGDVEVMAPQPSSGLESPVAPPDREPAPITDNAAAQTQDWDPPRVTLRVVAGPHEGQEFLYDDHNTLLVGRSIHAQLRLKEDVHFSRHHFRLEANPPSCFVMDLGSRNGTYVNGERITERFLKDGDIISGGRTKLAVSIRDPYQQNRTPVLSPALPPPRDPTAAPSVKSAPAPHHGQGTGIPPAHGQTPPVSEKTIHIQGYDVYEQIGAGDLGTVYRATRLATKETCALKVISPAARADERAIQTFLREASLLKQLQHQYIVRLIEMGASGSDLFLSTEYLPAIPWERLSASWAPSQRIRVACGIMAQILAALEYAHSRSMVHRDVKPGNILISRVDGKLLGKLSDFGLAKHYATAGMSQMTREGDVIGSLPYMSPEQFINSREARPACDLYSAGATLYWMISGQEPILLENHPCKFLAILEDPPVPLHERCPEVPAELAQLVHRALEKPAEKRFSSAAEMRHFIRKFAQ